MDHDYNFACLAQIRILLLPVGSISRSQFDKYASEIRSFDEIRLGDIPEDNKDERARFMPKPLSEGYLHLSFPTHPPPPSHAPLSLIRPSHFPLAVIGIGARSDKEPLASIHAQFNDLVSILFPADSLYPLSKQCFAFEDGDAGANLNPGNTLPGLTIIPSLMGNRKLYIGTLLADICSQILGEMGSLIQVLESPLGNEYLNASLLPTLPSLSEIPVSLDRQAKRDTLPPLPSINSQPDMNRISSPFNAAPRVQRTVSSGPYRQSTLGAPVAPKKRNSGIGVSSSPGRLYKVLGDFFMLSGRTEDAVVWYSEALITFKNPFDPVWQAAAFEGLATISVLDAWAIGHGLNNSISQTRQPWNDLAEKLIQAASLYCNRSPLHEPEHYPMLSYLYCCCVLRHAALLFAVWSAKGWGPLAFTAMLHPGPNPYLPPTLSHMGSDSYMDLERLSSISGVSRSAISTIVAQLHGPWLLHLGARERISILESAAALYSCIGYRRKEAYLLREVLGCVMDLVVCGRVEGDTPGRPLSLGEASGLQGVAPLEGALQSVAIRKNESKEGNDSVLAVLRHVCKTMGIDLEAVKLLNASEEPKASADVDGTIAVDDDIDHVLCRSIGWPELQVGVVREAVAVAEALPDFVAVAQFALSALKTLRQHLVPADQHHLYKLAVAALSTAQRRGDPKHVDYWTGNPIMSIAMTPLPIARIPLEKSISALDARVSESTALLAGATDPFLYNPRRAATSQRMSVVQGEALEFEVLLKNPYVFDLDLQSLSLLTSGVAFESDSASATIPANSYYTMKLTGTPKEPGQLVIKGCVVRAPGGASKEFIIPLATTEEEERQFKKRNSLLYELDRAKYPGLGLDGQRPDVEEAAKRESGQVTRTPPKPLRFMECNVVPEQPLIRIRRTSLTHSALMLYDGETSAVQLTLENVSGLPVDFVRLAFDDSTVAPAQQALAEGELSVFETYETEYNLIHQPLFSWQNSKIAIKLLPGQKMTFDITAFGKIGCTNGTVHISYSYVHRDESPEKPLEVFHTRQLSFPVSVTVYHMLECRGLDILPLSSFAPIPGGGPVVEELEWSQWCLFSVEIKNAYGMPFEVIFETFQEGTPHKTASVTVAPGSTSRVILPIKKILLPDGVISQIIPTLSDRQFVVTKSGLNAAEESLMRELFWYREEIFKCVEGRWKEVAGTRSGSLSLRQQSLTLSMLQTLRINDTQVQLGLFQISDEGEELGEGVGRQGGKYLPVRNEFVDLRLRAKNMSLSSLVAYVEWKIDPPEQLIFEGVLTRQALGRIEPGDTKEVIVPVCFLSLGSYRISAEIRTLSTSNETTFAGIGQLSAVIRES